MHVLCKEYLLTLPAFCVVDQHTNIDLCCSSTVASFPLIDDDLLSPTSIMDAGLKSGRESRFRGNAVAHRQ
jgi:hypothetical protein